jgi:hypothetical protein
MMGCPGIAFIDTIGARRPAEEPPSGSLDDSCKRVLQFAVCSCPDDSPPKPEL